MKFIRSWILLASAALLLGACNPTKDAMSADQASKSPAAATVNGTAISQRMVDTIAKRGASSGHPDTPEARVTIVDQLTLQLLIAQEAIKKGLDKIPEVAEQMDTVRQSVLVNAYVADFLKNNPVTDEMVKAEYERIKATITGTEYKARHILVDKESEAKDIIAKLERDPGTFEKLATERSKDEGSKAQGGDLGWIDLTSLVPEFGAAVSKLEKGQFTQEPVKTQFGYHVILLEDSRPAQAPSLDDVRAQLTQRLQQQNVKKQIETLKAAAKIEIADASASTPAPHASSN